MEWLADVKISLSCHNHHTVDTSSQGHLTMKTLMEKYVNRYHVCWILSAGFKIIKFTISGNMGIFIFQNATQLNQIHHTLKNANWIDS